MDDQSAAGLQWDRDTAACQDDGGLADQVSRAVDALARRRPRVHALVSPVAQPFVANIAAALGIDVSMTTEAEEVGSMARRSDALLVNLGMLDRQRREGVLAAAASGCPFVLDPVKVDRSPARLGVAHKLIAYGPVVVKGNAAEMAALAPIPRQIVAVTTGPIDQIVSRERSIRINNGTPMLDRVIATGCAAGLIIAAMTVVEPEPAVAAAAGLALLSTAAEIAIAQSAGPGSFAVALLDALYGSTGAVVAARLRAG